MDAGHAVDTGACRAQHAAETRAHSGDSGPQRPGVGSVVRGGVEARELQGVEPRISRGEARPVDRAGLVPRRLGNAFGHPVALGLVGHLLAALGPVVWARGMWPLRDKRSACAPQVRAAPPAGTGGAQRSRLDRGLGAQTAPPAGGHRVRIARVGLGLAPGDGCHGEGLPQHAGTAGFGTQVGAPRPGADTLDGHDEPVPIRCHGLEAGFRRRVPVAV